MYSEDTFSTITGRKITISHIKHASMIIQYDGLEIEIDPVTKLPPETDYSKMADADFIITHEHFDHCDKDAIEALKKESTIIIANQNSAKTLGIRGEIMKNGEIRNLAERVTLSAVPAYNTSPDPKYRDNDYILTIENIRIYIAGDTEVIPEMSELKDIDIAFLPCNLPYTMTPEQVAQAAKMFFPKVLFPYHYGETQIDKVSELLENSNIDVRIRNYK